MIRNLLVPHVVACALIVAALVTMTALESNRTMIDLYFALAGLGIGVGALATTGLAVVLVIVRPSLRRQGPWLMGHLGMVALMVWLGALWFGTHLA